MTFRGAEYFCKPVKTVYVPKVRFYSIMSRRWRYTSFPHIYMQTCLTSEEKITCFDEHNHMIESCHLKEILQTAFTPSKSSIRSFTFAAS